MFIAIGNYIGSRTGTGSGATPAASTAQILGQTFDPVNRYVLLYFSTGVFSSNGTGVTSSDLTLVFAQTGGTATNTTIASVKTASNTDLSGGEFIIRVNITITGTASGDETITLSPSSSTAIRDNAGNALTILLNTISGTLEKTYDTDYAAVLSYAVDNSYSVPIAEYRIVENNFVIDSKARGIWSLVDLVYPLSVYGDVNYFKLNWKTPGSFSLAFGGTIAFVKGTGYTPGSGHFLTGWIPSVNAVNYTLNGASVVHYSATDVASATQLDYGVTDTSSTTIQIRNITRNTGSASQISLNSGNLATLAAVTTSIGLFHQNRSASTAAGHKYYQDGVLIDGSNAASSALPNQSLVFGAERVQAGTISGTSTRNIKFFMVGGNMESLATDVNTMYTTYTAALAGVSITGKTITTDSGNTITTDNSNTLITG